MTEPSEIKWRPIPPITSTRGSTNGFRWTATPAPSASPTMPRSSWAISCYLELPRVGARFQAGQPLGTVESVKAVSEIFAPVSCEVLDANVALSGAP